MKARSRLFIFGLMVVLIAVVIGGGYAYLNYDRIDIKDKLLLKDSDIYEGNTKQRPLNKGVFVLTDNIKDHKGTYSAFTSVGYDVLSGNFEEYEKNTGYDGAFIFPESESDKLTNKQVDKIISNIENGQKVIVMGKTKLAKAIGMDVKYSKMINEYIMTGHSDTKIESKKRFKSYQFKSPEGFSTLATNSIDGTPVMSAGNRGKGKIIYSGSEIAPKDGSGYEIYPFLIEAFTKEFKLAPVYSRNNGAVYVDIGYHIGIETPAQITQKAKDWGYDQINVGVWASMTDDNVNYYKGIIEESHKRGIKVFAWFEFPMVSLDFWNQHPQWRQKTADGKDAKIDWRYLMALENEDCFNAAKDVVRDTMNRFEFDGIDIAEIYYEGPGRGFNYSDHFTPMNDAFRENFKKEYGFDPKESFNIKSQYYWRSNEDAKNKIIEERVNLITDQHKQMLDLADELKKGKPHLETNITMIDSIADKRMRSDIGLDANKIVELQKKYNFIMEIEDPFTLWTLGPERYSVIGENYRKIMNKEDRLYIDINIIDRFVRSYPTTKQRGVEVYSLIHNASKFTDKVIMYALATLEEEDMGFAPYAYAYDVKGTEIAPSIYEFESKYNFTWHRDMLGKEVYVDGKKYPGFTDDRIIIPSGKHKVEVKDKEDNGLRMTDINSNIILAEYKDNAIKVQYKAYGRCFINVNKKPTSINVNGKSTKAEIEEINGTYTIMLPKGENIVIIK